MLIQALQDQDADVRGNASFALGKIGEGAVDAVSALIPLLQDEHAGVRSNTAWALVQIGTPEALKAVEEYQ